MTEKPGVYSIVQISSSLVYVGSTNNLSKRWNRHRTLLADGVHTNSKLQEAYDATGPTDFKYQVLELLPKINYRKLIQLEQKWMNHFCSRLFNTNPRAGSSLGRKYSEDEYKKRLPHLLTLNNHITAEARKRGGLKYSSNPNHHKLTIELEQQIIQEYSPIRKSKNKIGGRVTMEFLSKKYKISVERIHAIIHQRKKRKCSK